jgi:hypothetical protein
MAARTTMVAATALVTTTMATTTTTTAGGGMRGHNGEGGMGMVMAAAVHVAIGGRQREQSDTRAEQQWSSRQRW